MGSKSEHVRTTQRERYVRQSDERKALLKEQGLEEKQIARDSIVKSLGAKIKQVDVALARIRFLSDQTNQLREMKAQKLAERAAAKLEAGNSDKKSKGKKADAAKEAAATKGKGAKKTTAKGGKQAPSTKGK